jgi:hypothetical protein
MMARSTEVSAGQFPVFDRAPLYLRETLVFPYTQGMRFQHAVIEKLDKSAFAEVFRRPPASTQHILHPEKYLDGIKPAAIELPKPEGVRGYKEFVEGELGELDHAILLRQYAGEKESDALAPQWRGGRYSVRENRKEKRTILLYASLWDTPESARRFFELYRKVLAGKWTSLEINSDTPNALAGRSDDGYFRVALQGERVTSIEGLPAALH